MRIKGKLFRYRKDELQMARELLAAEYDDERQEIIDTAAARGYYCETIGDCAMCDGDCKKSPDTGNMSFAPAVA